MLDHNIKQAPLRGLLGMGGGIFSKIVDEVTSLSFVAVSDQENAGAPGLASGVVPASAQPGDLAIMSWSYDNIDTGFTYPSGWTLIEAVGVTSARAAGGSLYKILESGEPGSTVSVTLPLTTDKSVVAISVYRPNARINSVTVGSKNLECTVDDPSQQTITASGVDTPVLLYGYTAERPGTTASIVTSGTLTTSGNNLNLADDNHVAYYEIFNDVEIPGDRTWDCTDIGQQMLQSFYIQVSA